MTNLGDLANETFINIFSYLSSSDLASTSLVSRRWHVISEPVLYREPSIYRDPNPSNYWRDPRGIALFLRTLLTPGCERLAFHVRGIYLDWSPSSAFCSQQRWRSLASIGVAESSIGVTPSSDRGSPGSHVVQLMHLLPHLRRLHVMPADVPDSFNDLLDAISPTQPLPLSFHSLTNFKCDWSFTETGVSAQATLALLQLPHMKTLHVHIRGECDGDFPANVRGTSGVTTLYLRSGIPGVLFAFILSVPRALESFTYLGPRMDGFVGKLGQLRSTLTNLRLYFDDLDNNPVQGLSFRDWPLLRALGCSLAVLVGFRGPADGRQLAEALPACIQELEIDDAEYYSNIGDFWCFEEQVDLLVQLVSEEIGMVPRLERLKFWLGYNTLPERLLAVCDAAGVSVG